MITSPAYPRRVKIVVNGQPREVAEGATVLGLLEEAKLTPRQVAVEVNRRLRKAADYDTPLAEGDAVEIVTFVGGG